MLPFVIFCFLKSKHRKIRYRLGLSWLQTSSNHDAGRLELGRGLLCREQAGSGHGLMPGERRAQQGSGCLSTWPSSPPASAEGCSPGGTGCRWGAGLPAHSLTPCRRGRKPVAPSPVGWRWLVLPRAVRLSNCQQFCKLTVKRSCY